VVVTVVVGVAVERDTKIVMVVVIVKCMMLVQLWLT